METQKYTTNINLYREISSTDMKHSKLLLQVILLFIINITKKTNIKKKEKQKQKKEQK